MHFHCATFFLASRGKPGFRRAGYMGHLRTMANCLVSFLLPSASSSPSLRNGDVERSQTELRIDGLNSPPITPLPAWLQPLKIELRDSLIDGMSLFCLLFDIHFINLCAGHATFSCQFWGLVPPITGIKL